MAESRSTGGGGGGGGGGDDEVSTRSGGDGGGVREQDRFLPIANISRIMKKALPNNAKIAKDAKETMQECVSEFISFVTSEASDKCQKEKRKTINGDDLLWAMATLGFEDYIEPLKLYLQKYREIEGDTKFAAKGGEASTRRDSGGSQFVIQSGTSSRGDYQVPQQGSLPPGMDFSHPQDYSHTQDFSLTQDFPHPQDFPHSQEILGFGCALWLHGMDEGSLLAMADGHILF